MGGDEEGKGIGEEKSQRRTWGMQGKETEMIDDTICELCEKYQIKVSQYRGWMGDRYFVAKTTITGKPVYTIASASAGHAVRDVAWKIENGWGNVDQDGGSKGEK